MQPFSPASLAGENAAAAAPSNGDAESPDHKIAAILLLIAPLKASFSLSPPLLLHYLGEAAFFSSRPPLPRSFRRLTLGSAVPKMNAHSFNYGGLSSCLLA